MVKGGNNGLERISNLEKDGYLIEALVFYSQLLEHAIRICIESFIDQKRAEQIVELINAKETINIEGLSGMSMGPLIKELSNFVGNDSPLVRRLKRFKEDYREWIIHHIFSGDIDTAEIESKVKQCIESSELGELFNLVGDLYKGNRDQIKSLLPKQVSEI